MTQEYNGRGLPYSLAGSITGNLVTSTLYNSLGSTTEINLGNSTRTIFGYWDVGGSYDTTGGYYGRLWRIKTAKQPGDDPLLQDVKHTWDANGNLTQREDVLSAEIESFTYDFLDRLTAVSGPYTESYAFNKIGNITSKNGISYTYSTKPHAVTAVGSTSYSYDNNGNMITRGSQTLTYDVENRPVSISDGGTTSTFVYDGDGNRVKKTESGETILYVNKYYEKNLTSDEITTSYYLGAKLIAQRKGTALSYIHQDHLTSTSVTSDSSGAQTSTIKYFPFGATRSTSGTIPTDKKFTGQRLDSTGLYYYGARYYDANIGRFISADSIVPDFTNPQCLNRYSYCLNNPLRYTDPTGQWSWGDLWGSFTETVTSAWKTAGSNVGALYGSACSWSISTWTYTVKPAANTGIQAIKQASVIAGKATVEVAAGICEPAVIANKLAGGMGAGGGGLLNQAESFVAEHTIVPIMNVTHAGITNLDVKNGYIEMDIAEGGWVANTLKAITAPFMGNPIGAGGITIPPTPSKIPNMSGSLVIMRSELYTQQTLTRYQAHEGVHVVQQLILGPAFIPLYGLGLMLFGYDPHPLEVQADKHTVP